MSGGRNVPIWYAKIRCKLSTKVLLTCLIFQLRKSWRYVVELPYVPISEAMSTAALTSAAAAAVPARDVVFHFSGHFDLVALLTYTANYYTQQQFFIFHVSMDRNWCVPCGRNCWKLRQADLTYSCRTLLSRWRHILR